MKTEQFQYVIELYKTGSISKAAKKFYMSRPNLSNSIRSIEDELGFDILERGVNGVRFTEKGLAFVRHCMSIVKELDEIHTLASKDARLQFGVSIPTTRRWSAPLSGCAGRWRGASCPGTSCPCSRNTNTRGWPF